MNEPTQASPGDASDGDFPVLSPASGVGANAGTIQRGLWLWLAILVAGGGISVLLGHVEGALLFAGAGAFALAQASDAAASIERYRRFVDTGLPRDQFAGRLVRALVGALVPLAGAAAYAGFGAYARSGAAGRSTRFAIAWCAFSVIVCIALASRPLADALARAMFRGEPARTRRLTARLVVMALLLPPAALPLVPAMLASVASSGASLADASSLTAQLLGELAIAFAGVGLFVRRDWRAVRERLGLTAMRPRDLLFVVAGLAAAMALNSGSDWLEHRAFPALWQQDSNTTRLIAGQLSLATSLLLGVSAGVGEEITVRGALQPRLGIVLSALVFACGHVQYTWFGMATVGLLGMVLGTIRARSNTTTAIVVHLLYDVFAAVTSR
jgi:hypothetical protein